MNNIGTLTLMLLSSIITWVIITASIADRKGFLLMSNAESAVKQCEANLPRNQKCEVVITARVKGG